MKRNDITALHSKTVQELEVQLNELLVELAQARLQKAAGKLKNTHTALLSDDVARVKTVLSMKKKTEAQVATVKAEK